MWKYQNFLSENFNFLVAKLSVYLNRLVLVMWLKTYFRTCAPSENWDKPAHCAVWSESFHDTFCLAKGAKFLHADNWDWSETAWMRMLIWVFVGHTCQKVFFFSISGSYFPQKKICCTKDAIISDSNAEHAGLNFQRQFEWYVKACFLEKKKKQEKKKIFQNVICWISPKSSKRLWEKDRIQKKMQHW